MTLDGIDITALIQALWRDALLAEKARPAGLRQTLQRGSGVLAEDAQKGLHLGSFESRSAAHQLSVIFHQPPYARNVRGRAFNLEGATITDRRRNAKVAFQQFQVFIKCPEELFDTLPELYTGLHRRYNPGVTSGVEDVRYIDVSVGGVWEAQSQRK